MSELNETKTTKEETKSNTTSVTTSVTDKINNNEYVQKIKQHKHYKYIKIGAIVIAAILVFCIVSGLFADKNAQKAEEYLKSDIVASLQESGVNDVKVKTNVIGKNQDSSLYAIDTVVDAKLPDGQKFTYSEYTIVYSDGETVLEVNGFEYTDADKNDIKDIALASLAKG